MVLSYISTAMNPLHHGVNNPYLPATGFTQGSSLSHGYHAQRIRPSQSSAQPCVSASSYCDFQLSPSMRASSVASPTDDNQSGVYGVTASTPPANIMQQCWKSSQQGHSSRSLMMPSCSSSELSDWHQYMQPTVYPNSPFASDQMTNYKQHHLVHCPLPQLAQHPCNPTGSFPAMTDASDPESAMLAAASGLHSAYALPQPKPVRQPFEWLGKKPTSASASTGKTRTKDKYRVVYTDHQRLELEKEFYLSRYITIRRKAELAQSLHLSERQVKIWFQNRRAKERKVNKKKDDILLSKQHSPSDIQEVHSTSQISPSLSLSSVCLPNTTVSIPSNNT